MSKAKKPTNPRKPTSPLTPNASNAQDSIDRDTGATSNEDGSTTQATIEESTQHPATSNVESTARSTTQLVAEGNADYEGYNRASLAVLDSPDGGPVARETRSQATNRWILEGRRWEVDRRRLDLIRQHRAAGMSREQAADRAWAACLAEFPPPGVEPVAIEPVAVEPPAEPSVPPPPIADPGVSGLGEIPPGWPELPANAQLQVEIAWVSANRLRVRSGNGVDLSRAMSPAPSYSALSWLETSILFPAKFADISVKATAQQDDEREGIRREKLAIEEIRGLLAEMLEG